MKAGKVACATQGGDGLQACLGDLTLWRGPARCFPNLIADALDEPLHRLRLAGDKRLPLGFRQGYGDDPFAFSGHGNASWTKENDRAREYSVSVRIENRMI